MLPRAQLKSYFRASRTSRRGGGPGGRPGETRRRDHRGHDQADPPEQQREERKEPQRAATWGPERSRRPLAQEVPSAELHEVRRFDAQWEADASVRLRSGGSTAIAAYDIRGRIRGADGETAYQRAVDAWLADHLQGKDVLLLAGSNAEAAELARRVQSGLAELGQVGQARPPCLTETMPGPVT